MYYPYQSIVNWGISNNLVVINVVRDEVQTNKHYLETRQPKIIQLLLESYTNLIAGKSSAEIQNINEESAKRFVNLNTGRERAFTNFSKNPS